MAENFDQFPDRIAGCIENKTIFITGGTGFLGKVVVEKFLRCFNIKRIYMLIRDKKGKDPKQRLKDIFQNPLFNSVRELKGEQVFDKCIPITGDVGSLQLGISKENRAELIEEIEIVLHAAATIRFDEPLKKAILLNVRGVKEMLQLAKEMKKLQVYVHVSTSYCHLGEKVLYERAYPPAANPHEIIKTVEWLDEDLVNAMTSRILGSMPNTYAFTKNIAEALCVEQLDNLPIIIIRPSVVVPVWLGPIKGWTDNINGPTGLLIAAGKGVLRTMYCNQESYADFIPVDIVANGICVILWDAMDKSCAQKFYNFCSSAEYKISWEEIINIGRRVVYERMPLNGVAWYPGGGMTKSRLKHNLAVIFFHYLPAIFVDTLLTILGYKPVLWRVQQRITKGFDVLEYYANNQWDFNNDVSVKARDQLNAKERELYKVDGRGIDYFEYFTHCTHAARLYILKETDDTIPAARRHMKVMYWVDVICKSLFMMLIFYLLYKYVVSPIVGI